MDLVLEIVSLPSLILFQMEMISAIHLAQEPQISIILGYRTATLLVNILLSREQMGS